MSDRQQPPQGYPPQQQAYQPPPPGDPYPPTAPPKKRTGLIVAIVVIALLLLCCCSAGAAFLVFSSSSSTDSMGTPGVSEQTASDPEAAKRAADWEKVQAAFVAGDYTLVKPDARQQRLAGAAIAALLPDFTIDEIAVEPGHYDKAKNFYYYDSVYVRLHLTTDPEAKTAYSFDLQTPEAEAAGAGRDNLDMDTGYEAAKLEGKTWLLYPADTKAPLLRGITDPAMGALVKLACTDWPGGLPTKFVAGADGSMVLSVETWDAYRYSGTYDRIDATYVRDGDGWKLKSYVPVIEPKSGSSTEPTQT